MSNKKRIGISSTADETGEKRLAEETSNPKWWRSLGNLERFAVIGFALLLTAVVFGATGFPERIIRLTGQQATVSHNLSATSYQSSILANPVTTNTPQLSKEYLYAGSRLLAVEDAGANAAPPADLAVWRPGDGVWYVLGGSQGSQQTFFQWGVSTDVPVQGDYDGDGKTDFAIYRSSNNSWWINYSASGNYTSFAFGQAGDAPIAADFDGDGKTDAAVFRPVNGYGYWYYFRSSDQVFTTLQFGL